MLSFNFCRVMRSIIHSCAISLIGYVHNCKRELTSQTKLLKYIYGLPLH